MNHSGNIALIILVFMLLGCACPRLAQLGQQRGPQATPTPSIAPLEPQNRRTPDADDLTETDDDTEYPISMAKYNQLKNGMARTDVERLLGGAGEEVSNTTGGGVNYTVNKWRGPDYSSIILSFRNDKIFTKSQVGLK